MQQVYTLASIHLTKPVKDKSNVNCRSLGGEIQYKIEKQMENGGRI